MDRDWELRAQAKGCDCGRAGGRARRFARRRAGGHHSTVFNMVRRSFRARGARRRASAARHVGAADARPGERPPPSPRGLDRAPGPHREQVRMHPAHDGANELPRVPIHPSQLPLFDPPAETSRRELRRSRNSDSPANLSRARASATRFCRREAGVRDYPRSQTGRFSGR